MARNPQSYVAESKGRKVPAAPTLVFNSQKELDSASLHEKHRKYKVLWEGKTYWVAAERLAKVAEHFAKTYGHLEVKVIGKPINPARIMSAVEKMTPDQKAELLKALGGK
jgi:hypothetical protein